jgi:hypothetical protein
VLSFFSGLGGVGDESCCCCECRAERFVGAHFGCVGAGVGVFFIVVVFVCWVFWYGTSSVLWVVRRVFPSRYVVD